MSGSAVFDALCALRDATEPSHGALAWAWREVARFIETRLGRTGADREDIAQLTLIKVMRGVRGMAAETPAGGEAWLRTVHASAEADYHRRKFDPVKKGLDRRRPDDEGVAPLDRVAAPEPERHERDEAMLDELTERVMDRVELWLAVNVTRAIKRLGDRKRAHIAWMANALGRDVPAIAKELALEEKRDTLYKWIERGREQVLLPAMTDWSRQLEAEDHASSPDAAIAREVVAILEGSRRADAGKPRAGRRAVSRVEGGPSHPEQKGPRGSEE